MCDYLDGFVGRECCKLKFSVADDRPMRASSRDDRWSDRIKIQGVQGHFRLGGVSQNIPNIVTKIPSNSQEH